MITPKFYGTIKQGKFAHQDPQAFQVYVATKFKEDQEVELTIKRKFKRRTSGRPDEETNFNGYYWGVIIPILSEATGELDAKKLDSALQILVGNTAIVLGKEVPKGTSQMSGAEFADYCSKIRMLAGSPDNPFSGQPILIPEPHEADYGL
jgi:hypothetical protein